MSQSVLSEETEIGPTQDVELPTKVYNEEEIMDILMGSSSISFQTLVPNCKINTENATKVAKWIIVSKNSRLAQQRLKWLTGIVQYGLVESISGIQKCFSPIIQLIFTSELHATACHLLYLIATPALYKWQVERIAKCSNILGLTNPLVGLLSRLKSLRPDLVPQTMPHQSSALSFPRLPLRFREALLALSEQLKESGHSVLLVGNDRKKVTKKMRLDIVPRVENINLKSATEVEYHKMAFLSQFDSFDKLLPKLSKITMPNHIGSLLNKKEHLYVLTYNYTPQVEAVLSQWVYLTLCHEFLEKPQHLGREGKELLLNRIIEFRQTTGRKLMVVYDFLAEYFREWDGVQYSKQMWQLIADVPFLPYQNLEESFLRVMESFYTYCDTLNRLKVIETCRRMIHGLMLDKFGPPSKFQETLQKIDQLSADDVEQVAEGIYVINEVIRFTERLLYIGLTSCGIQTDIHLTFSALEFYLWLIHFEADYNLPFRTFCQPIAAYSALFFSSPLTISMLCQLLCKYSELGTEALYAMAPHPALKEFCEGALANGHLLNRYVTDMSNCLLFDKAFAPDRSSYLATVPKESYKKVIALGPVRDAFSLTKHPAFAGVARAWLRSRPDLSGKYESISEAVASDQDSYISFLFDSFPAISAYIQRFHGK